jgi:hypothetical protein
VRGTATDPRGTAWHVQVEWIGRRLGQGPLLRRWHERRRRRGTDQGPASDEAGGDSGWVHLLDAPVDAPGSFATVGVFLLIAALVALLVLVGPWLLALLLGAVELVLIVLACVVVFVTRTVRRRPWRVVATSADGQLHTWDVVGWRRSRALVRTVCEGISAGLAPGSIVASR